ncbi:NAD-dependent epimerase/dehydratase family protein [Streptomyces ficellus]|uniref:NAD-dependent epimerase/dehydratase family protein n=1 Tax=Streptomyces ficellus TaxID=1977088 RepID=A0A6I6FLH6_9ACTN|nr:NAD-dependent epimerase/dehydratase family protein [Streptomyces ficellus]QGV78418.1 NAD-dependent epimerase/dehydratase family protein [Streptomyces ficellus]
MPETCVIGGSRYFGKRLVQRLLDAGHHVTVVNRGSSAPPAGARHLIADRDDERALADALGARTFDVVVDQVCYTPRQADVARRVLGPRTGRYLMTSTVEVYAEEDAERPVGEDAFDARTIAVDLDAELSYGEGKRQAEAVFARDAALAFTAVRVAHVLGGADDFTGRLAHYADRIRAGRPIAVPAVNRPATYVYVEEIAAFLAWAAERDFTGPVNAASHGPLTTVEVCAAVEARLGRRAVFQEVESGEVSPLSFRRAYAMDNARATALGHRFLHTSDWLERAVAETLGGRA